AFLLARRGRTMDLNGVMKVVLGGGLIRLLVLLAVVVGLIVALPLHRLAFVGGLGVVYVLGLVLEVAVVLGRPAPSAPRDA
ncbi:MAG TPA: hypothetical protein VF594_09855, partial [Rubricoccaceae bacterium]